MRCVSCLPVTLLILFFGIVLFAWGTCVAFFTFFLLSETFNAAYFMLVVICTLHVLPLGMFFSCSGGPMARERFRSPILHVFLASVGVGFLLRFPLPNIGFEGLVAMSIILLLLTTGSASYSLVVSRGSSYSHYLCDTSGHAERSRVSVVRATDVENGIASAGDLAWRRRAWLVTMRERAGQRATRHWASSAFRRRTLSGLLLAPLKSSKPNDLRAVVDRVIWMKEAEIFRLVVSYL